MAQCPQHLLSPSLTPCAGSQRCLLHPRGSPSLVQPHQQEEKDKHSARTLVPARLQADDVSIHKQTMTWHCEACYSHNKGFSFILGAPVGISPSELCSQSALCGGGDRGCLGTHGYPQEPTGPCLFDTLLGFCPDLPNTISF